MKIISSLPNYIKVNLIVILVFVFTVLGLTVGYSILSKELNVGGSVLVGSTKDIRINSMSNLNALSGGFEVNQAKYTKTTFNTSIGLSNLDSTASYTLSIKNYGTTAMKIKTIISTAYDNDNIIYNIEGIDNNTTFTASEEKQFTITFKYKDAILEVPNTQVLNALFEIEFEEYIPPVVSKEYATGDMLLDLRGTDAPSDNVWYDRVSNKAMNLTSTIYDSKNKYYDFSTSGAYGKIAESIIPITGNFTLEANIQLSDVLDSSADHSIVSQVSDVSNDPGRMKLNLKGTSLISFVNAQTPTNTNLSYAFTTSPVAKNSYLLQLVRNGDKLDLYLNGKLISSNDYLAANEISTGPFKLARWNNNAIQQYDGAIYAVRVYGRALSSDELTNNFDTDVEKYRAEVKTYDTLKEYALGEQIVSAGNGLYLDNIGNYVYRGNGPNNYLKISGSDDLYRIISYNDDNTMKIINTSAKMKSAFDLSGNRNVTDSTYCINSETVADSTLNLFYGCNAWNSTETFSNGSTTGKVNNDSTVNSLLNTTYYNTLNNNVKSKILNHSFAIGAAKVNVNRENQNLNSKKSNWNGLVGTITTADVFNATVNSYSLSSAQTILNNYLVLLSGSNEVIWTMTATNLNTYDVYAISLGTSIGKRRASRETQETSGGSYTMYTLPAFYINSNVSYSGVGTMIDPFIIN